jgi:6-phosphogluconolactonase
MMWRSIGSVTVLALLLVGCGGGGGDSSSSSSPAPARSPPPNTIGGTVTGLLGEGLTLGICVVQFPNAPHHGCVNTSVRQIYANGAFTLPARPASDYIITRQPSSPTQRCVLDSDSTSVTVSCTEYAYVTNAADNTLSSYSVDPTTGALTAVDTPVATGASPNAISSFEVYGQDRKFVFVANEGSNDVSEFSVSNTTGALTAVPGSPFPAGTAPQAMTLYAPYYLLVANTGSDNISVYSIDGTSGALTPGSPATVAAGKGPTSIAFNVSFYFVANHGGSNDISVFDASWAPVPGSPFSAGGNPLSLALGGEGKFLYSANPDATNPTISGFSVDPSTGALSPLSGSPFTIPVSHYMATDQTGAYLYVTSGATILGYAINASTGALTALPGFPVAAGANAYSITIDPTNQFLYVTSSGAATVSGFKLDASTGALAPMSGSPFPAGNRPGFLATF